MGDWNATVGSQEITGITVKFGLGVQNEAGQRLTEFCQKNTLVIANTLFQEPKRQLYTLTSPMVMAMPKSSWLHSLQPKMEKLYCCSLAKLFLTLCSSLWTAACHSSLSVTISWSWSLRTSIHSAKTRPGADCASDHELLIAKFSLKLKKVGKTTRTFRSDLNQILYDYTVRMTNRL